MFIDWHQFHLSEAKAPPVVDSRRRMRICLGGFAALVLVVFARATQLELTQGAAFRVEAAKPSQRQQILPGMRGRILARDGTVLACDKQILALAVHYRYLEQPADARWLRLTAQARLPKADRKNPRQLAAAEACVRAERDELCHRLCQSCGLSPQEWDARARRIQARVEQIAQSANRRRRAAAKPPDATTRADADSLPKQLGRLILDALSAPLDDPAPPPITVAEQLDYHVMVEDLWPELVTEIESHPEQYPAVKIVSRTRRTYPCGNLAAHVLGHVGPIEPEELKRNRGDEDDYRADNYVGRMGLERQYEPLLRGHPGLAVETADRAGRMPSTVCRRAPGAGRDLILTLDSQLQRTAEELLDAAINRVGATAGLPSSARLDKPGTDRRLVMAPVVESAESAGGAIVVVDVHTGAVRAAASAPRFDPNWFTGGKGEELAALLSDLAHPLVDRVSRTAISPGSVFKTATAIALLESAAVEPQETLTCQGYLHEPDRQRCEIYVRRGVGHGEVTLADALCTSCNVYFFHYGGRLGPIPLVDWAQRFGLGRPTGVDLPGESAGTVPTPETIQALEGHAWRTADTELLSIGQGSLRATPLQVACMMAAVANGGQLVTPHLLCGLGLPKEDEDEFTESQTNNVAHRGAGCQPARQIGDLPHDFGDLRLNSRPAPPRPIPGLKPETLEIIREGLRRVVCDPEGTAHGTAYLETIAMAGKTGTAETGEGRAPHAWFAGYAPAEKPKLVFVVALEHAGSGATAAGPVVKRLVLRTRQLGML